jgi:hypothetical protein
LSRRDLPSQLSRFEEKKFSSFFIGFVQTADLGVVSSANTTIRYQIKIKNTGNVGLLNLQVRKKRGKKKNFFKKKYEKVADDLVDNNRQLLTCQPVPEGTTLGVG